MSSSLRALALHDRIYDVKDDLIKDWIATAKAKLLDSRTGLLIHRFGSSVSRGSSTGWNSFYLPFLDRQFATEQYTLMLQEFRSQSVLGMAGLREYARGIDGSADVDSGPVLWGISTSETGFALAGATWNGDETYAKALLRTAEMVGFSFSWKGLRRYLLAPKVGDAIMLAMRTARPWE